LCVPLLPTAMRADIEAGREFAQAIQAQLRSTYGPAVLENEYGFAGLYSIPGQVGLFARRCRNPVLVACTDGVGTKLKVAQMAGKHDTVGIDLVAMSVNDLLVTGAMPLFFLDYIATGRLKKATLVELVKGIAAGCRQADCALLGGETAEMPGFYRPGEYDMAGFAVGMVERARLVNGRRLCSPGDVILGVASSGLHSNGYSLVRKLFFEQEKMGVDDHVADLGCTLGEELLRPTRIYVRGVRAVLERYRVKKVVAVLERYRVKKVVHAIAHITGGGLPENLPRVLGPRCVARIRKGGWPVPPVFALIQRLGGVKEDEMFRVFNMGIGLVLVVSP